MSFQQGDKDENGDVIDLPSVPNSVYVKYFWTPYINFLLWFHFSTQIKNPITGNFEPGGPGRTSNVASRTEGFYTYPGTNIMFAVICWVINEDKTLDKPGIFKNLYESVEKKINQIKKKKKYEITQMRDDKTGKLILGEMDDDIKWEWQILRRFLTDMLDDIDGPTQCSSITTRHYIDNPPIPTIENMQRDKDRKKGNYYVCEQSWSAAGMTEPESGDPTNFNHCHYSGSFNADEIREHELRCRYVREADQKKNKRIGLRNRQLG